MNELLEKRRYRHVSTGTALTERTVNVKAIMTLVVYHWLVDYNVLVNFLLGSGLSWQGNYIFFEFCWEEERFTKLSHYILELSSLLHLNYSPQMTLIMGLPHWSDLDGSEKWWSVLRARFGLQKCSEVCWRYAITKYIDVKLRESSGGGLHLQLTLTKP